ncbi:protein TOPAZ1 isoform X3 [Misgurnus anguillicaudatus]|uniref:protein TOPAZ1 isoform X3 n=1 Tax=Misgurnus anguillicaudatus TaxID=75329 RepID=UPI003CCFA495
MLSSGGVSRIKLKRDLFKVDNKLETNKRRWTGPKTVSGLNSPAKRAVQDDSSHQETASASTPVTGDLISTQNGDETGGRFGIPLSQHDDEQAGYNKDIHSKVELRRCLRLSLKKDLKRLVKNSCCALCGDVKYRPPPNKNLARLLKRRPRAGRPRLTERWKKSSYISEPLHPVTTPNFQFEKYPMVKLCDVARVFTIASRDFSCVLPPILERKRKCTRVGCLKKEFLVHPHPHGIKKHRSMIANQSWEVSTPTNSCASFSSGEPPLGATGSQYVSETAETRDGCAKDSDGYLARNPEIGRMSQVEGTTSVLSHCGGQVFSMKNINERCEGTSSQDRRIPPLILRRVTAGNGCDSRGEADNENGDFSLDDAEEDNGGSDDSDTDMNSPECFSCQRTQAYVFFHQPSCARACKTWPFPRTGPPEELRSSLRTGPCWIVNTSFLVTTPTALSETTKCLLDNDVQIQLCQLTEQSLGSVETKEVQVSLGENESEPTELESNQSVQEAFEDFSNALKLSAPAGNELVNNNKLTGLGHVVENPNFLLGTPDRQTISVGSKNLHDIPFFEKDDSNLATGCETRCGLNSSSSTYIVSQTSSAPAGEIQDEPKIDVGAITLYNPDTLSELCLKVEMLKAQCPSSAMTPSTNKQGTQNAVTLEFSSNPQPSGKIQSRSSVTDSSSSADENEHDGSLSSDEHLVEYDDAEILGSNDSTTGTPPQSSQGCAVDNSFLDVSRAYEEDVLVLDVIQDDPELFGTIVTETMKTPETLAEDSGEAGNVKTGNHCKIVWDLDTDSSSKSIPTATNVEMKNAEDGSTVNEIQSCKAQPIQSLQDPSALKPQAAIDLNNNQEIKNSNNLYSIKTINTTRRLVMDMSNSGHGYTSALRTSSNYCKFYFNEHNVCHRSACWFLHMPKDGDEMFCMDRIQTFCLVGIPPIVLRAVEVFMGYYSRCSPGVSFSLEIVRFLLSSLLNLGFLREFMDVINLLLTHKSPPPPEIVLSAFKHVRDRGLIDFVSELILLTSKVVEAGCVFSVDQCEVMQSHLQMMQVPRRQMDIFLSVKCRALATNPLTAQISDLAQAVVRVEMLKHQEDWLRLAHVFCDVCVGPHSNTELHRFYCCVTMALLKETKDKLTLSYEVFAESVCQQVPFDDMVKIVLGRIGVSLILRYHRTREWTKGVKLINVMFRLHIEFTTLKGLMGNEYKVSRCHLVTTATELFIYSGSIEGALKMLRADNWFVTSNVWPCDPPDIDYRKRVLTLLAGKTSHRDTFDILANLPGLKQPINGVQINGYTEMFNAHLRLCVMKQTLPVAADILDFMLTQGMVPETLQLQSLIHKLGKQNNWSRARALFKRARSAGYYSAVVCEMDGLFLPCSLSEIEMTLAFEMFITFIKTNLQAPTGSTQPLLITLKRQGDVEDVTESVYLAAGCRLLSAALIPNPKLSIRYTAVNQRQEQLFLLDRGSAHKWLSQNEQWALEMWVS